ncbi:CHC2 zinc finger [Cnuella takakiae]|uniref:CHC2 zinc finger n=1 Tax=Cnuella takakiae TaxID=1302690 RepID=A0A1M5JBK1_9BACT|nr:toprim domain-containing protein [Cnuella takakiae]OLY95611.1 hypothetical protein BUE76_00485 [Cnuella takakiae]SHG37976.1 CHC2 zinc finger [Cnuella takakiae]
MRSDQAKKIPLFDLLAKLGYHPAATHSNGDVWYLSPFRQEKTASFKINVNQNVWFDHGEGVGGNILDFVMHLEKTDVRGALHFLEATHLQASRISPVMSPAAPSLFDQAEESKIEILQVKPVFSYPLKNYLKDERRIKPEIGYKYLKEIRYQVEDKEGSKKEFYSLGFQNRSGGWALRNMHFTRAVAPNDITVFENGSKKVKCFEGFMDFLSFLTMEKQDRASSDVIVLNSVSLQANAIEFIKTKQYGEVHTYFDNDVAGEKALANFKAELPGVIIKPFNHLYQGHKDYNDLLRNVKQSTIAK